MIATLLGRLQTKIFTYLLLGLMTIPFWMMGGVVYLWAFSVAMLVGLLLETVWGICVEYQPGWLSFVFAAIECVCILSFTTFAGISMPFMGALLYYTVSWGVIQLFLLYILPVWRSSWSEDGGELW